MGKADRHQDLVPGLGADRPGDPFAVGRRAFANIHGNIIDRTAYDPEQLVLTVRRGLEMQPAQGTFRRREGVIVLHEAKVETGGFESALIIGLGEKPAVIAELFRRDDLDVRDLGWLDLQGPVSPSIHPAL